MGMIVSIYRHASRDCTNGGVSSKVNGLCLTNVDGPFTPNDEYPAARLESHYSGILRIVPEAKSAGTGPMFGGNFAATSDDRFSRKCEQLSGGRFYGAVAIHDRWEG